MQLHQILICVLTLVIECMSKNVTTTPYPVETTSSYYNFRVTTEEPLCAWTEWGKVSKCQGKCSPLRVKTRTRKCLPELCEDCEGDAVEKTQCDAPCCEGYPKWGKWQEWSPCSRNCGRGYHRRFRFCLKCSNGKECEGKYEQRKHCKNLPCCPRRPSWTPWGHWSVCPVTCGFGVQTRFRKCRQNKVCPSGQKCPGRRKETQECFVDGKPPFWSLWGQWTECSVTCGAGKQIRQRTCIDARCPNAEKCEGKEMHRRKCNAPKKCCPDPKLSKWSKWGKCSKTCGKGTSRRSRTCETAKECRHMCKEAVLIQTKFCNEQKC